MNFFQKIFGYLFPAVSFQSVTSDIGAYVFPPTPPEVIIANKAFEIFKRDIIIKEGTRKDAQGNHVVYLDSLGILTAGIGHRVTLTDNLKLGQKISERKAQELFAVDSKRAFDAAKKQAKELNKYTPEMIAALASVNFQLGTFWRSKFPNTWNALKSGNVTKAVNNLKNSKWNEQTPVRVAAFISTIQEEYS